MWNLMKMTQAFLTVSLVLAPGGAYSHEGHDVIPGAVQAQHGGTVKGTKELFLELVQEGKTLKLFPTDHDKKPIPLKDVKITATAQLPKGKKKEPVVLTPHDASDPASSHFMGAFDAKGAYRYSFEVSVEYKGKKDKATFQVEPKS